MMVAVAVTGLALRGVADRGLAEGSKSTFVKEVRAQNKHHLAATLSLPEEKKPPTIERDWEDKLSRKSWRLSEGPLTVRVTLTRGGPPDGLMYQTPVVSVSAGGKEMLKAAGSESFPDNPIFVVQIAEMDPGNPYAEIVFSTYSGGAHCCSDTHILASSKDGKKWRDIEAGAFDGGPLKARDLDGDGRYEIATRDNAFLYTFACYACSTAPLQILRLDDGKMKNVSGDAAYRPHQIDSLRRMVEWAGEDVDRNGFLAGYVAQKILLGEGAAAWKLMLKHYERKSDWGLESCTVKEDDKGECPKGRKVMLSFPQALEKFLTEAGYELKK